MNPIWQMLHPRMTFRHLGLIPAMLNDNSPKSAKEQVHNNYQHGGGWFPAKGFKLNEDNSLSFEGDPNLKPLAKTKLRNEEIFFYEHSWVAIVQPDRSFEVARID